MITCVAWIIDAPAHSAGVRGRVPDRSRCFVYYELDRPRPYLPGLYTYMKWFPEIDRMSAAVAPSRVLDPGSHRFMTDDEPPAKRDLLFSFMDRNCHAVRDRLFSTSYERDDVVVVDTTDLYDHYQERQDLSMQREYVEVLRRSRWALCPAGSSTSSLRLFEAMRLGIAPVVLSDNWQRPPGPDWGACCL